MRSSGTVPPTKPAQDVESVVLRDHFATIALAQIIAIKPNETADRKALEAYQIADSMMRHREHATVGL